MTLTRIEHGALLLLCNSPECEATLRIGHGRTPLARREAAEQGWARESIQHLIRDYCPTHAESGARGIPSPADRVAALRTARYFASAAAPSKEWLLQGAATLIETRAFSDGQISRWLGVSRLKVTRMRLQMGVPPHESWGINAVRKHQLDTAIKLAEAGAREERPKMLMYQAHHDDGMSYDAIGGLLGMHESSVLHIVDRLGSSR